QAWQAITSLEKTSGETAVLRARIKAAGVADAGVPFSVDLDQIKLTPSQTNLIVSTLDRKLLLIDLQTLVIRNIADGMSQPSTFAASDTFVYAVRQTEHLELTRITIATGYQEDIADLAELPDELVASDLGVLWLNPNGQLYQLADQRDVQLIAMD